MSAFTAMAAREELIRAALRVVAAAYADDQVWAGANAEHADELLALAARDLVRTIDADPEGERPVGWGEVPSAAVVSTCCDGTGMDDMTPLPCQNPQCPVLATTQKAQI